MIYGIRYLITSDDGQPAIDAVIYINVPTGGVQSPSWLTIRAETLNHTGSIPMA